ncbi:MAG: type II toxin-antitoxin system VapC family toxin [Treponema sp.]|jgi:PIN domain nuclease of toxin-antitoxin system|nr:type II toxin-antitoxin system VapC family toxin [Treponema sp.]
MTLVDTHIFIWLNEDKSRIPHKMLAALDAEPDLRVSPISFWEVAMLNAKGRITLSEPVLFWLRHALEYPKMDVLPLTPEIAARSAGIVMHGDPADRLIVATALEHACRFASVDSLMTEIPSLRPFLL